jgi:hypothetical protein
MYNSWKEQYRKQEHMATAELQVACVPSYKQGWYGNKYARNRKMYTGLSITRSIGDVSQTAVRMRSTVRPSLAPGFVTILILLVNSESSAHW